MENTMAKIFQNPEFGVIEVIAIDGKEFFPATDCAKMLGYSNPYDAIIKHCKVDGVVFCEGVSETVNQYGAATQQKVNKKYIDEGNLYRLITHSKLPSAERFERWVFDEVLPSIRMSGGYSLSNRKNDADIATIISQAVTAAVSETVTQIMKQLIPVITEKSNETSDYETFNKRRRKPLKRPPKVMESLPENVRREIDDMLTQYDTYGDIQIFLRSCGVNVSKTTIGKYAREFYEEQQ